MGTRGERLYYLFHKSRATPVSPGLLTQSCPLIGQCCPVPSSDWLRGSPSPARPHLSSEHGIRDDRENRTEHNNLSTPSGPQQLCKLRFKNSSLLITQDWRYFKLQCQTHSEIGWHAVLKIIQCLPIWMKTNNQRICRFNFSFVALNTLWHFTAEFLWLGLRKQECEYDWFEPHYRRVSWSMECRARAFCRIVASSEWGGSKIISYT